jgi:hypothetical protein
MLGHSLKGDQEFESTSLRQQVSTAEKPYGFPLKIAENPRNSACFALKTGLGESVLLDPEGKLCGSFLWAYRQSGL